MLMVVGGRRDATPVSVLCAVSAFETGHATCDRAAKTKGLDQPVSPHTSI